MVQIDLGLGELFVDEAVTTGNSPTPDHPQDETTAREAVHQEQEDGTRTVDEDLLGAPVIDSGLSFGM